MESYMLVWGAFALDLLVGDPRFIPHPVVGIGHCITRLEKAIRAVVRREAALKAAGLSFPLLIGGGAFAATWLLLYGLALIHPWAALCAELWLISTTVAAKGLAEAGNRVYGLLQQRRLEEARGALSMVVGRDTAHLDGKETARGAIETVAENITDAIVSPLFYALIGGAPLAMLYRAVNTLDSMVGYKNDRYLRLGWASARCDDALNWIPARLSALAVILAARMLGYRAGDAWRVARRDARKHPSPNSGFTEAAVAGALGIQLGGVNYYGGLVSERARLGDPTRAIEPADIRSAVKMMYASAVIFTLFAGGLFAAVTYW